MNNLIVLDMETNDRYISRGLGGGWVYALNVPTHDFKVLGFSFKHLTEEKAVYMKITEDSLKILRQVLALADGVLFHNAQYDLGCLLALGIDITNIIVYDTNIIGKLYDNRLFDYSLDNLGNKYLPVNVQKKNNSLIEIMEEHRLGPLSKCSAKEDYNSFVIRKKGQKTYMSSMKKWSKENMEILQEKDFEKFAYYAKQDVIATGELFKYYTTTEVSLEQAAFWSSFTKRLVLLRCKGLKIDMQVIKAAIPELENDTTQAFTNIKTGLVQKDIKFLTIDRKTIDSPKQLSSILTEIGYLLPKSVKGNESTAAKWMIEQKDTLLDLIVEYRTLKKLLKDFCLKILEMQEYTCPEGRIGDYGRVYPSYTMLGAGTGRLSSSGPNIQNIPVKNAKWGKIIRSIFIPDDSKKIWVKLDWQSQEPRLGVHYAVKLGAEGAYLMQQEFLKTKVVDLHTVVAIMASIDRKAAKTINLGLNYGMGAEKLGQSLGLSYKQTQILLAKYHAALPYIKPLNKKMQEVLTNRGFIYTLLKRKLRRERYVDEDTGEVEYADYKASNKAMQGSGGDLMYLAFAALDDAGFNIKCTVHDEFNIECSGIEEALEAQYIMETIYKLEVPLAVEVEAGTSWGTLTKLEESKLVTP